MDAESEWIDAVHQNNVVFSQRGVYVHPTPHPREFIAGSLTLFENEHSLMLAWKPVFPNEDNGGNPHCSEHDYAIRYPISDVISINKIEPTLGLSYPHISVTIRQGATLSPFFFHEGGIRDFIRVLGLFVRLSQDSHVPSLYLVNDMSSHLSRSLNQLRVSTPGVTRAPPVLADTFVATAAREASWVLEGFAKVPQLARDIRAHIQKNTAPAAPPRYSLPSLPDEPPAAQPITASHRGLANDRDLRSYDVVIEANTDLEFRPILASTWPSLQDASGRFLDSRDVRRRVFYWNVEHDVRCVLWPFLLELYPWESTQQERTDILAAKTKEYESLVRQWKSISPEQEANFSKFRDRKHLIEKDVLRTDRRQELFMEEDSPMSKRLFELLVTYSFYDFDIGYVQGMSDLLAPILSVIQDNEAEAFWCFVNLMKKCRANFHKDQRGMNQHLADLRDLLSLLDPVFFSYLEKHDATNMYFCYRWLLISYKREFDFMQILRLWEAMWSGILTENVALFVAVAILKKERDAIMAQKMSFDDILKHINDLSRTMDVEEVLTATHEVFSQLSHMNNLPLSVARLVRKVPPVPTQASSA